MTLAEINECVTELNLPKFTGKQIADWVYQKRVKSIDEMTNISLKNRQIISENTMLENEPLDIKTSVDGTRKMLFRTASGKFIETVTIPEGDRLTFCIVAVGCKMNCDFCMTERWAFRITFLQMKF